MNLIKHMKPSIKQVARRSGIIGLQLVGAAVIITLLGGSNCPPPCSTEIYQFGGVRGTSITADTKNQETILICPGDPVTLGWFVTSDVKSGSIDNLGAVQQFPGGMTTIFPQKDTKYRLRVKGQCDKASQNEVLIDVVRPGDKSQLTLLMKKNQIGAPTGWDLTLSDNAYSPKIIVTAARIVLPFAPFIATEVTCKKSLQPNNAPDVNFKMDYQNKRPTPVGAVPAYMVGNWHIDPNWSELGVDFNDESTWKRDFPALTIEVTMECQ